MLNAKGGGKNGYNSTQLKCDELNGIYSVRCDGSGYEKPTLCSILYEDKNISDLLVSINNKILSNTQINEVYISGIYKITIKSTDSYNYYSITINK